jgi:heat shock protein HslJ
MRFRVSVFGWAIIFIVLAGCCVNRSPEVNRPVSLHIEGPKWLLVAVNGVPAIPPAGEKKPFLMLDATRKVITGYAGCNNFSGDYKIDGASVKFGLLASTRMFCTEPQMSMETGLFKALEETRGWKIKDGSLLLLDDNGVLARFMIAPEDDCAANTALPGGGG